MYNNPLIPADPFMYDLRWIVGKILQHSAELNSLDERIRKAVIAAMDRHNPIYFENAEALINSDIKTGALAYIEGYYTAGDGGANLYLVTEDYNDIIGAPYYITLDGANRWALPVILTPWVTPEMFGAYGDGTHDDTTAINKACEVANVVYMLPKTYMVDAVASVKPAAGTLIKGFNTTVQVIPTDAGTYAAFFVDKDGVTIDGINIIGDLDDHAGSIGEYGFGIRNRGKNNVYQNCIASKCWGDGFYCDNGTENVSFINCTAHHNRRQGMSVVDCDGLIINDCEFTDTSGTAPQAGIDFEPFEATQKIQGVKINNLVTARNSAGLLIQSANADITINGFTDIGSLTSMQLIGDGPAAHTKGAVTINNAVCRESRNSALYLAKPDTVWPLIINGLTSIDGFKLSGTTTKTNSVIQIINNHGTCGGFTINDIVVCGASTVQPFYAPLYLNHAITNGIVDFKSLANVTVTRIITDAEQDNLTIIDDNHVLRYISAPALTFGPQYIVTAALRPAGTTSGGLWTLQSMPNKCSIVFSNNSTAASTISTSLNIAGLGTGNISLAAGKTAVVFRFNDLYYGSIF